MDSPARIFQTVADDHLILGVAGQVEQKIVTEKIVPLASTCTGCAVRSPARRESAVRFQRRTSMRFLVGRFDWEYSRVRGWFVQIGVRLRVARAVGVGLIAFADK